MAIAGGEDAGASAASAPALYLYRFTLRVVLERVERRAAGNQFSDTGERVLWQGEISFGHRVGLHRSQALVIARALYDAGYEQALRHTLSRAGGFALAAPPWGAVTPRNYWTVVGVTLTPWGEAPASIDRSITATYPEATLAPEITEALAQFAARYAQDEVFSSKLLRGAAGSAGPNGQAVRRAPWTSALLAVLRTSGVASVWLDNQLELW